MAFLYFCFLFVFVFWSVSRYFVLIGFSEWKLGVYPTLITRPPSTKSNGKKHGRWVWIIGSKVINIFSNFSQKYYLVMSRLWHFIWFNKYWKMDANAAIFESGLKQVLNIPIPLDKNFQGGHLDLQQLHNYSLIRKDSTKIIHGPFIAAWLEEYLAKAISCVCQNFNRENNSHWC